MRRRTIMLLAGLALLLAVAFLAWYFWLAPEDPADKRVTAVVIRGDIEDTITATGTLQPKDYVDVGTRPGSGAQGADAADPVDLARR